MLDTARIACTFTFSCCVQMRSPGNPGFGRETANVVHSTGEAAAGGRCAMPFSAFNTGVARNERCMLDGVVPVASSGIATESPCGRLEGS